MRHRILKRALKLALIVLVVLLIAGAFCWVRLPGMLEREVARRLGTAGFPESSLQVESVGLHQLEVTDLSMSNRSWQVRLGEGTVRYRPLEILHPELRSVHLDHLTIDLNLQPDGPSLGIASSDTHAWRRSALEALSRPPLRAFSLDDGLLRLHRGQGEATLPFEMRLTHDAAAQQIRGEAHGSMANGQVRLEGRLDRREGLRIAAQLQLPDNWNPWLTLALPEEIPSALEGLQLGPASITLDLRSGPDLEAFELSGAIPELPAQTRSATVVLDRTEYHARLREDGTGDMNVTAVLREFRNADLHASADAVSVALLDLQTLEARLDGFQVQGPNGLRANGDFNLADVELASWPDTQGALEFRVRTLEFADIHVQPFDGVIQGGPRRLEWTLSELVCEPAAETTLRLTGLEGVITTLWEPHAEASLTGRLGLSLSPDLGWTDPVPFFVSARRDPEGSSADLLLELTNTAVRLLPETETVRLSGTTSISATLRPQSSEWQADVNLALGDGALAGLTFLQAKLAARGTLVTPLSPVSSTSSIVFDWLEQELPGVSPLLQNVFLEIDLSAGSIGAAGVWTISEPSFQLHRAQSADSELERVARFAARAASVLYEGILLTDVRGSAEILPNGARIDGSAMLDTEPFSYRLNVARVESPSTQPPLAGDLSIDTVRLRGLQLPLRWTGGRPVQVSGKIGAQGQIRLVPGERLDFRPSIDLALERIEWPEQGLTVEGVRGTLSGTFPALPNALSTNRVRIDRILFGKYEATGLTLRVAHLNPSVLQVEVEDALLLEGHVRIPPFLWDLQSGRLDVVLDFEQVSLARLADLIPRFAGSIEGELDGHLPIHLEAGQITLGTTTLRLGRNRAARLSYPADGLLTRGSPADSDRHRQLQLLEKAFQDLQLNDLTLDLYPPDHPQTPVRIRLEGIFTSAEAVIPVNFNLNLNGDLDQVLRLFNLGKTNPF